MPKDLRSVKQEKLNELNEINNECDYVINLVKEDYINKKQECNLKWSKIEDEYKLKNYLMIEDIFKEYGLIITCDDFNYILKFANNRAKDSYRIHLYEQLNKNMDSNMINICNTIGFYENETRTRIRKDLEERKSRRSWFRFR